MKYCLSCQAENYTSRKTCCACGEKFKKGDTLRRPALADIEKEILQHVAYGKSVPEIAEIMSVTESFIYGRIVWMKDWAGAATMHGLAAYAVRKKIVD